MARERKEDNVAGHEPAGDDGVEEAARAGEGEQQRRAGEGRQPTELRRRPVRDAVEEAEGAVGLGVVAEGLVVGAGEVLGVQPERRPERRAGQSDQRPGRQQQLALGADAKPGVITQ